MKHGRDQSPQARKAAARITKQPPAAKKIARGGGGDLSRELALTKKAARAAGEILRGHFRRGGYTIASKGKDNPVTQADLEADRMLKRMLHDPFPEYGWLSEETADSADRLARRRVWIVDPLDGTREFINGVPEFCVAIALV
ncbi:MAG TPA: inositol monophosphatase family protein, partial [Candidatus Binataceae bacterium]|nr:inositol monophosphatase family protein [Candidatus Binataceae bacterium]